MIMTAELPAAETTSLTSLWSVKECATYLKKSHRWLWAAIARPAAESGSIPHFRVGCAPRFVPTDIEAWVRAGCPPAATFAEWNSPRKKAQIRQ